MELWHTVYLAIPGFFWFSFTRYLTRRDRLIELVQRFETACIRLGESWTTATFTPCISAYNDVRNYQIKYFPLLPMAPFVKHWEQLQDYQRQFSNYPHLNALVTAALTAPERTVSNTDLLSLAKELQADLDRSYRVVLYWLYQIVRLRLL